MKPFQVLDFIDYKYLAVLMSEHRNNPDVISKNTGPQVSHNMDSPIIEWCIAKLKQNFGEFDVLNTQVFETTYPHILHNDWSPDDRGEGLAFLIPLAHDGDENPNFVVYDQYYRTGAVKLYGGGPGPRKVYYNKPLLSYEDVENLNEDPFDQEFYDKYLTHLKPNWVQGLSVNSLFEWKPTSMICFHRNNIHSASDFRKQGVTKKVGLSIFTNNCEALKK